MARLRDRPTSAAPTPSIDFAALRRRLSDYRTVVLVIVAPEAEDHPEVLERKRICAELTRRNVGLQFRGADVEVLPDGELVAAVQRIETDLKRVGYLERAQRRHAEHEQRRSVRGW